MNFKWSMQNAVLAHSCSSLFLPGILCGRQLDQGFFQFTLKAVVHWCILCHLLKSCFVSLSSDLHSLLNLLLLSQHLLFVSETAASFSLHELWSSLLHSFTLITFPVLATVSQSVCQSMFLNQHKSISCCLFLQPRANPVFLFLLIASLLCHLTSIHTFHSWYLLPVWQQRR